MAPADAVPWTVAQTFLIARNPAPGTRLPVLLKLPLAGSTLVLATRETWPGNRDLFCYELDGWPDGAEVLEQVPVASCVRHGSSVQLILQRRHRRRSVFVWTRKGSRTLVFWRSERSIRAARPGVRVPQARGLEGPVTIAVDERERYAWRFAGRPVTVERRALPVGDYAVFDGDGQGGRLVGAVERKRAEELASDAVSGKLALTLAELATLPRAVVIVEGRLSRLLKPDVPVRQGWLLNLVAGLQAAYPNVPFLFAETPKLAADLAYRWLSACVRLERASREGTALAEALAWDGAEGARARAAQAVAPSPLQTPLFDTPPSPAGGESAGSAHAPLSRPERQRRALAAACQGETWTLGRYAEAFGVSKPTASLDLWDLAGKDLLSALGKRRSLRFVAADAGAPRPDGAARPGGPDGNAGDADAEAARTGEARTGDAGTDETRAEQAHPDEPGAEGTDAISRP